jgi:metal-responsive CopG/Arc/MetJ family transcriptional regulator
MAKRMQIGFSLKGELAGRIDAFAKDHELTRSGALKLLVREALDARQKTGQPSGKRVA